LRRNAGTKSLHGAERPISQVRRKPRQDKATQQSRIGRDFAARQVIGD
jgi:hypothetical protein